jgi:hypothetical protein
MMAITVMMIMRIEDVEAGVPGTENVGERAEVCV